ncbi:MAG: HAMP domain-containing protein [Chloroflexi bacterium]|nr:HAMP domain-containing protein [Chloroflexota bacterium]
MFRLQSLRAKLILAFLVTVLLPLVGTSLYGNWTTSRTLQAQALDAARVDLRLRAEQIEGYLRGVRQDILFLSRTGSLAALLAASRPTPALIASVESDFAAFAATHPGVFQVRYLGATGMEVVRVDSTAGGIEVVPADRLQNKAERYYFAATMELPLGAVFISPLDLNRERGVIEGPPTPTIRYATPVFRPDGSRAGLVILNLYAEPFLRFARAGEVPEAFLALVDAAGYYLVHPDPAREFGGPSDLHTGASAAIDYSVTWAEMERHLSGGNTPRSSGVYSPSPGTWLAAVHDELLPLGLVPGWDSADLRVLVYQSVQADGGAGPRWLLLNDAPRVNLFAAIGTFRLTAIGILVAATLGAQIIAIALARSLTAPILGLTEEVRRLSRGSPSAALGAGQAPAPKGSKPTASQRSDEIGELASAFKEMSTALNRHLEQLSLLNRVGHQIAARLERPAVLAAAAASVQQLLPVDYCVLAFNTERGGPITHTVGDARWAHHRDDPSLQALLEAARADGEWRTTGLPGDSGKPAGYLCCAPLCVSRRPGLVELYGSSPALGDPTAGNLLSTLAGQISIALENAELYEQLAERHAELQALVEKLITVQEEERRVVAYDIHDGLIQMLVGARLQLSNALTDREREPELAESQLRKGLDELGAAIVEARRVIEGLRPAALDDLGLVPTIRHVAEEALSSCAGELEFLASPPDLRAPTHVETTAFRIAQEAITNARKYSGTPCLRVAVALTGSALTVEVRDWGRGFDPTAIVEGRGLGLMGMRDRARLLGGDCLIESTLGAGTTVRAILPIASAEVRG